MLKAIIFDLNGIFILSPKLSERFEKDFGVPVDEFMFHLRSIMDIVRRPKAGSVYSYWQPILKTWGIDFSEKEFLNYWFKAELVSDPMIKFCGVIKKHGIKIIILTNNFKERSEFYGNYDWMHKIVDKVYFSWQTGLVKPDRAAWQNVLQDNNLLPQECIYFDDHQKNLTAAESLGIKSYLFTNQTELENIIGKFIIRS